MEKVVKKELDMVDKLIEIVHAPQENGADYFIRIGEIIDFIEKYFVMNVCFGDIGEMTLNELRKSLIPQIILHSKFPPLPVSGVWKIEKSKSNT
jgi:hypothetical protein